MNNVIPALAETNVPSHVRIQRIEDLPALLVEVGKRSMMGYAGDVFFGTAFLQGQRLQFTTAMTVPKMIEVTHHNRATKKDVLKDVLEKSNRPAEPQHAKQLRSYLLKTACESEKFILPSFMFNYGVGLNDADKEATLMVFANDMDGAAAWPAILMIPQGAKLDTTDGAHRRSQMEDILADPKVSAQEKDNLRRNAVSVTIVFESERKDSHQDFADCGKAKAITKSMVVAFDVRDARNRRSTELVKAVPFLGKYVDATASNVNLSAQSKAIWSMSAIRMFVGHVVEHHAEAANEAWTTEMLTEGAEAFIEALIRHLPQLKALEQARVAPGSTEVTTGALREVRGGDVALRGIGMAIFARAFLYCLAEDMPYDKMAATLAKLDWSMLLKIEKSDLPDKDAATYAETVLKNANPLWRGLLTMSEGRAYRPSSRSTDIDRSWDLILRRYFSGIEIVDAPVDEPAKELLDF